MNAPNDASRAQMRAADPSGSVWLSANAGSGKTRVLTDRVARLLLGDVSPQHILCLTYTKAAATEMQNRLFKRLGGWAMLDDGALRQDLIQLGVEQNIDEELLANARRLFARAIETPGGLKIQTIHSFCASLLRRFPLEAGVSPQFSEMDDRSALLLREEIIETLADNPDTVGIIDAIAQVYSGEDFSRLTAELVKHKDALGNAVTAEELWSQFGLTPGFGKSDLHASVFLGSEGHLLRDIIPILQSGSKTDATAAAKLNALDIENLGVSDLKALEGLFLYGATAKAGPYAAKIGNFPTKATRAALGPLEPKLNDLMGRVETAREKRISLYSAEKCLILYQFAAHFLPAYATRKQANGWLDFDDLILKARDLLNDPLVAQWVLFRLDGGIDHILVDEAQDTSPAQWNVIERLAQEFTSGEGARSGAQRSIFVVGDKKQSIYSFQGADPDGFDRMKSHFQGKLEQVNLPFQPMELQYSFRSASPILGLVDTTFETQPENGLGGETKHIAFKNDMPGRVDLWPAVPKTETDEDRDWFDPIDLVAENHHTVILAQRIARQIRDMITNAALPEEIGHSGSYKMRRVRAGDILILVQRRSELFHEIIRACKAEGVPIAGADRLKIGGELAVKDIAALLSFLATPEDDLSLAAALRSPLFGWSQQMLHASAQPRKKGVYLWEALRSDPRYDATIAVLQSLRKDADFLRPFDLIERILTRHDGRRNLLARLGTEAQDGIDALLNQALVYERNDVPSLTGFLTWLQSGDVEIKRQMDSASDRVRVMTVHGSKGLEAPIVIMPDTARRLVTIKDELYPTENGVIWKAPSDERPQTVALAHAKLQDQQEKERDRLLYVAMTRAEKWLIVAAAGELGSDGASWYDTVARGLERAGAQEHPLAGGVGTRFETGDWAATIEGDTAPEKVEKIATPDWLRTKAPAPVEIEKPRTPSGLGGAKALSGDSGLDEEAAMMRGTRLHRLLEHLPSYPPASWPVFAQDLLTEDDDVIAQTEVDALLHEAQNVLQAAHLKFLFAETTLAEVDITAALPELNGSQIVGAIDRLIIEPSRILAVDFKSNAIVPKVADQVPEGVLRQMGAYSSALSRIYPDRPIETAILWTKTASLMPLPHAAVISALRRAEQP
ncbi:double-strand break repair helicase AddA [Cochlodiniinecator piscidefendens]|uniref:double-strand break repair helicase AddA n=1 Tax=Cochlodiniinecator piscidefendens TaxID=2715756 RepID=UPI00140C579E|nr:double-strand break repair helicase AddA [Cochlodiniinecator piscidefendens]